MEKRDRQETGTAGGEDGRSLGDWGRVEGEEGSGALGTLSPKQLSQDAGYHGTSSAGSSAESKSR